MKNQTNPMRDFSGLDRRLQTGQPLAIIVEIGLFCLPTLGERSARLLFRAHDVPSTVASRVLFHPDERRRNAICHLLDNESPCGSTQTNSAASETVQPVPDRDKSLAAALRNALRAMMLTHGCRVAIDEGFGVLNFEREMLLLRGALGLLSINPDDLAEW